MSRPTQDTANPAGPCVYGAFTRCGPAFQHGPTSDLQAYGAVLLPRHRLDGAGLGCFAFDRHYSRNHFCFLLLRVLRCFSSPRSPLSIPGLQPGGLTHSEIPGSKVICTSPGLIAAYHVLHRL